MLSKAPQNQAALREFVSGPPRPLIPDLLGRARLFMAGDYTLWVLLLHCLTSAILATSSLMGRAVEGGSRVGRLAKCCSLDKRTSAPLPWPLHSCWVYSEAAHLLSPQHTCVIGTTTLNGGAPWKDGRKAGAH